MADVVPMTGPTVLALASRALGKIDLWGRRGVTMLSIEESEAMALLLAGLGLIPTAPGKAAPAAFFQTPTNTPGKEA